MGKIDRVDMMDAMLAVVVDVSNRQTGEEEGECFSASELSSLLSRTVAAASMDALLKKKEEEEREEEEECAFSLPSVEMEKILLVSLARVAEVIQGGKNEKEEEKKKKKKEN